MFVPTLASTSVPSSAFHVLFIEVLIVVLNIKVFLLSPLVNRLFTSQLAQL